MRRSILNAILLAVLWSVQWAPEAIARQAEPAFSSIRISGGPTRNVNRNFLHLFWQTHTGGATRFEVPFHVGYLETGLRTSGYTPWYPAQPAFDAVLVYVGWGVHWRPVRPVRLSVGARAGNLRMLFDIDTPFSSVRSENEFTAGTAARLDVFPDRMFGLFVEASYEKTFTYHRLNLVHVGGGLSVRLNLPRWIGRVLE